MKLLGKVIGIFVLLGALGAGAALYFTSDMVGTVDTFFAEVQSGEMDRAYASLSMEFQKSVSLEQLNTFLEQSSLKDFKEASWGSRSFENNTGMLEGTVTLTSGASVPLSVKLLKEEDAWKIYHLSKQSPGLASGETPSIPDKTKILRLIRDTTAVFSQSVVKKDMEFFHEFISNLWQSQYPVEKLEEAYGSLYDLKADWGGIAQLSPVLSKAPSVDANGILLVSGFYPTRPDQLLFTYKYIREDSEWKLFGLHINFKEGAS